MRKTLLIALLVTLGFVASAQTNGTAIQPVISTAANPVYFYVESAFSVETLSWAPTDVAGNVMLPNTTGQKGKHNTLSNAESTDHALWTLEDGKLKNKATSQILENRHTMAASTSSVTVTTALIANDQYTIKTSDNSSYTIAWKNNLLDALSSTYIGENKATAWYFVLPDNNITLSKSNATNLLANTTNWDTAARTALENKLSTVSDDDAGSAELNAAIKTYILSQFVVDSSLRTKTEPIVSTAANPIYFFVESAFSQETLNWTPTDVAGNVMLPNITGQKGKHDRLTYNNRGKALWTLEDGKLKNKATSQILGSRYSMAASSSTVTVTSTLIANKQYSIITSDASPASYTIAWKNNLLDALDPSHIGENKATAWYFMLPNDDIDLSIQNATNLLATTTTAQHNADARTTLQGAIDDATTIKNDGNLTNDNEGSATLNEAINTYLASSPSTNLSNEIENNIKIVINNGMMNVIGTNDYALYTLSGQKIDHNRRLSKGIYIFKSNNDTRKILVQ